MKFLPAPLAAGKVAERHGVAHPLVAIHVRYFYVDGVRLHDELSEQLIIRHMLVERPLGETLVDIPHGQKDFSPGLQPLTHPLDVILACLHVVVEFGVVLLYLPKFYLRYVSLWNGQSGKMS